MLGDRIYISANAACHLITPCAVSSISCMKSTVDGEPSAVPVPPGHARYLYPYPPSRRGRR